MAIYAVRMQVIGRRAGRSAVAAAAYRSGERLRDERTGKTCDYRRKENVYGNEILKPAYAPERLGDRAVLWNEVERTEKRKDSQLCREFLVALPQELTPWQRQALTREYVQAQFVAQGMIADIGYHDFYSHNPHAHIMLTMREVSQAGFGQKQRKWNQREQLQRQREAWAAHVNRYLERAGHDARIDHRSLQAQGIARLPQPKLGAAVLGMESRGIQTEKGDEFRRVAKVNRALEWQQANRERLGAQIEAERERERVSAQIAESTSQAPSVEQKWQLKERQQALSPRSKRQDKRRDQGLEM